MFISNAIGVLASLRNPMEWILYRQQIPRERTGMAPPSSAPQGSTIHSIPVLPMVGIDNQCLRYAAEFQALIALRCGVSLDQRRNSIAVPLDFRCCNGKSQRTQRTPLFPPFPPTSQTIHCCTAHCVFFQTCLAYVYIFPPIATRRFPFLMNYDCQCTARSALDSFGN